MSAAAMIQAIVAPAVCRSTRFTYSHDPYDQERSTFAEYDVSLNAQGVEKRRMLHKMLITLAPHIAYPEERIDMDMPTEEELQYMTQKVFIGQLPFRVTEMQLVWLCRLMGVRITCPQRITKKVEGGELRPTGGVHVFCRPEDYWVLHQNMHKRLLFDDTGVWFAASLQEKLALDSYVRHLHANKKLRHQGRPYDTVVIQQATSTYVPRQLVHFDETY